MRNGTNAGYFTGHKFSRAELLEHIKEKPRYD